MEALSSLSPRETTASISYPEPTLSPLSALAPAHPALLGVDSLSVTRCRTQAGTATRGLLYWRVEGSSSHGWTSGYRMQVFTPGSTTRREIRFPRSEWRRFRRYLTNSLSQHLSL